MSMQGGCSRILRNVEVKISAESSGKQSTYFSLRRTGNGQARPSALAYRVSHVFILIIDGLQ